MDHYILNGETEIEKEYLSRTAGSKALDEIACQYLPGGSTRSATDSRPYPVYMESGEGCYLSDVDGNEYIDFMNNYTVLILGHGHPRVSRAITKAAQSGIIFGAPSQSQYELAGMICERVPSIDRIRFTNTGTEAIMYAFRAARAVTGKNRLVKMEGGFHGNTEQTEISVSPDPTVAGPAQRPLAIPETQGITPGVLEDIIIAPFNDTAAVEKIILEHRDEIAAVVVEPVMGASGMIPASDEFLRFLRDITAKEGILLIFDEIITFRLSTGGYQRICGVKPDLTAFGKIIGGGLPIGAFGGRADIMEMFSPKRKSPIHHSGTFNGNAITMAAGIAALEEVGEELISRINALGKNLRSRLQSILDRHGVRGQVTGYGSLMNVHFSSRKVSDLRSAKANWKSAGRVRDLLNLALKNQGIYTPSRVMLCISSPMTDREIQRATQAFEAAIDQVKATMKKDFRDLLA